MWWGLYCLGSDPRCLIFKVVVIVTSPTELTMLEALCKVFSDDQSAVASDVFSERRNSKTCSLTRCKPAPRDWVGAILTDLQSHPDIPSLVLSTIPWLYLFGCVFSNGTPTQLKRCAQRRPCEWSPPAAPSSNKILTSPHVALVEGIFITYVKKVKG